MDTYIKQIKLLDGYGALIKSNWTEIDVIYKVFVQKSNDEWALHEGKIEKTLFESQCKKNKVSSDTVKQCIISKNIEPEICFELDQQRMKFSVLMREKSDSIDYEEEESFIEHTYACLDVEETSVTVGMVVDLILEMQAINDKYHDQCKAIKKLQEDYRYIQESFEDLKAKHLASEKKLMTSFLHLLNSKKIALNDTSLCRSKILDTSSDSDRNRGNNPSTSKLHLEYFKSHKTPPKKIILPEASSSSQAQNSTKKTSSTSKRTPSKSLLSQIQSITSDSDSDTLGIIRKSGTTTRSVFNGKKITPVKPFERETRESSIERKTSKNVPVAVESQASSILSSTSESESGSKKKSLVQENAQKLLPSSETSPDVQIARSRSSKRESQHESTSAKKRKLQLLSSDNDDDDDPYACETLNILGNL